MKFESVKDSGKRESYSTGMVRDTQDGKPAFSLLLREGVPFEEQMLTRWAQHMANGAKKYGDRNWEKAATTEEMERFKASAIRHLVQWACGDESEDHAAAVFFNINAYETTKYVINKSNDAPLTAAPLIPCIGRSPNSAFYCMKERGHDGKHGAGDLRWE